MQLVWRIDPPRGQPATVPEQHPSGPARSHPLSFGCGALADCVHSRLGCACGSGVAQVQDPHLTRVTRCGRGHGRVVLGAERVLEAPGEAIDKPCDLLERVGCGGLRPRSEVSLALLAHQLGIARQTLHESLSRLQREAPLNPAPRWHELTHTNRDVRAS
jgi:hypothetical protein